MNKIFSTLAICLSGFGCQSSDTKPEFSQSLIKQSCPAMAVAQRIEATRRGGTPGPQKDKNFEAFTARIGMAGMAIFRDERGNGCYCSRFQRGGGFEDSCRAMRPDETQ